MTKPRKSLSRNLLVSLGIPTVFIPGLILASILGWEWQEDLATLYKSGGYKQSEVIFPTEAMVVSVTDGDTFIIDNGQVVRMIGINAPNRGIERHEEASEYLKDLIEGEKIYLEYDYYQDDKFGRILAYVWESCVTQVGCSNDKRMVNWVMLKKGYAEMVTYQDRRALLYKDYLQSAVD